MLERASFTDTLYISLNLLYCCSYTLSKLYSLLPSIFTGCHNEYKCYVYMEHNIYLSSLPVDLLYIEVHRFGLAQ